VELATFAPLPEIFALELASQVATEGETVNLQPLSLWTVKKGEAESNEAEGRPNGITPTGTWRYGMRVPLSSAEPIAKHNLPFRPPTQMLPSKIPISVGEHSCVLEF